MLQWYRGALPTKDQTPRREAIAIYKEQEWFRVFQGHRTRIKGQAAAKGNMDKIARTASWLRVTQAEGRDGELAAFKLVWRKLQMVGTSSVLARAEVTHLAHQTSSEM